jgi:hypothetical protein
LADAGNGRRRRPTRRAVTRGAAWTIPVIAVATPASALAASGDVTIVGHEECQCPGNSHPDAPKTHVFQVEFGTPVASFTVNGPVTVDGVSYPVTSTTQVSPTVWGFRFTAPSSADLKGAVSFSYTADGVTRMAVYAIVGTPPCNLGQCS